MAVVNRNMRCKLCGRQLGSDALVAFPPFVHNTLDPLYVLHDAVVHRACLDGYDNASLAYAAHRDATVPARCIVCHDEIAASDPSFRTSLLASDATSPAFPFNFTSLHLRHFAEWPHADEFRAATSSLLASDRWSGARIIFDPLPRWESGAGRGQRTIVRRNRDRA